MGKMQKHPFTYAYLIAIAAAFLGEFGKRGLDAMSGAIVKLDWCPKGDGACLFVFQIISLLLIFGIVFTADWLILRQRDWTRVTFSKWNPVSNTLIGGIRMHNGTRVDLEHCEVEFIGYANDQTKTDDFGIQDYMKNMGVFPKRLSWNDEGREPKSTMNIGREKVGYIMLLYPDKGTVLVNEQKPTYNIAADGLTVIEPVWKGWLYLRVSASVDDVPLPPRKIAVRLEIENNIPEIKEIREMKNEEKRKIHH